MGKMTIFKYSAPGILAAVFLHFFFSGAAPAATYNLRAEPLQKVMPDGKTITMWGFASCDAAFTSCTQATVPGPTLSAMAGEDLVINLRNNLNGPYSEPTSVVIPGLTFSAAPAPVMAGGRVRSFVQETPADNTTTVTYTWNSSNLKAGTYLYQSGTHPSLQVQMGLYGALKVDALPGQAYGDPATAYTKEVILLFSGIDPAIHKAVETNTYGPGKAVTSTIAYRPSYFMINGQPYSAAVSPLQTVSGAPVGPGDTVLLRFLNAGLNDAAPVLQGLHMTIIAEDGNPLPFKKQQYSLLLSAGRTTDILLSSPPAGNYPVYDRRLNLSNGSQSPGGMLAYLNVSQPFVSADPGTRDFGVVRPFTVSGPQIFTVTNRGSAGLTLGPLSLSGSGAAFFDILSDECSARTLTPSTSCTIQAVFSPGATTVGKQQAGIYIPSGGIPSPTIPLQGCSVAFADVASSFWAENHIVNIFCAGITSGCAVTPPQYCPLANVTRDQMAVFIIRAMVAAGTLASNFTYTPVAHFPDVPESHWAFRFIQKAKDLAITGGCGGGNFCPAGQITREQVAAFLIRAIEGEPAGTCAAPPFADVPVDNPFCRHIERLAILGITGGCGGGNFCPSLPVTRDQMAVFLARAFLGLP